MNNKGNIIIVILAAIGLILLLMLGVYAQQQLIHDGPVNPGRYTQPSEGTGPIVPNVGDNDETEDSTSTETTGETEDAGSEADPTTQATEPDATGPQETTPHTPTDTPPAFSGAGGERDDESPLDPD